VSIQHDIAASSGGAIEKEISSAYLSSCTRQKSYRRGELRRAAVSGVCQPLCLVFWRGSGCWHDAGGPSSIPVIVPTKGLAVAMIRDGNLPRGVVSKMRRRSASSLVAITMMLPPPTTSRQKKYSRERKSTIVPAVCMSARRSASSATSGWRMSSKWISISSCLCVFLVIFFFYVWWFSVRSSDWFLRASSTELNDVPAATTTTDNGKSQIMVKQLLTH
jgi:hypothetical protein